MIDKLPDGTPTCSPRIGVGGIARAGAESMARAATDLAMADRVGERAKPPMDACSVGAMIETATNPHGRPIPRSGRRLAGS
jgi:hypothetical protein